MGLFDDVPMVAQGTAPPPVAAQGGPLRITVTPRGAGGLANGGGGGLFDDVPMAPPKASAGSQLLTDFQNQGAAAAQGTTPNVGRLAPNLISSDVYESDTGEAQFKDPATGQMVTADRNKHVVMRDPTDNTLKVFARSADTNEGRLAGAGRVLMMGAAAGAPTVRPGLPLPSPPRAPSIEALKEAATAGYQSSAVKGLEIAPDALANHAVSVQQRLMESGLHPAVAPAVHEILADAQKIPQGAFVTGDNLKILRESLGAAAGLPNGQERKAAMIAKNALDEFMGNIPGSAVRAGSPEAASAALGEANANYSAAMHAQAIDKKLVRAELRAAAANSGQNVTNSIRQRMADILLSDQQRRGFTGPELRLMERIVRGTPVQNALRGVGNLLGGGGGMGAVVTAGVGGMATGGPGVVAPAVGYLLKKVGNALTQRQVSQLSEMIRARSPLAKAVMSSTKDWSDKAEKLSRNPTFSRLAAANLAARNLSNNLASVGIKVAPEDLLRSLQGPVAGRAEDQQPPVPRPPGQ